MAVPDPLSKSCRRRRPVDDSWFEVEVRLEPFVLADINVLTGVAISTILDSLTLCDWKFMARE